MAAICKIVGQSIVEAGENGGETWSVSIQALALMTVLTLLPAFLLMMSAVC